jgi:hypothetical protein
MKRKLLIVVAMCSITVTLLSQEFIHNTRSVTEIEYETTGNCLHPYMAEVYQVFEIDNLIPNRIYTFQITDPDDLDYLDDIQFEGDSQDWYIITNNGQYQEWRWEGSSGESDYINVDVYIDDYSDVELGLTQSFAIQASYQIYQNIYVDNATSSIEIYTPTWIDGSFLDCSNPVQFELKDKSSYATGVSWVIKQSGVTKDSGSGVNASASNISTGAGEVEYTISFGCGLASLEITKDFWFGKFESTPVVGQAAVCPNSLYVYTANVPGGHSASYSYSWTYPSGWYKYSQWSNNIHLQTPILLGNMTYGPIRVSITNACGTSGYSGITTYPGYNCGGYYMASPNPSSEYIEVDLVAEAKDIESKLLEQNPVIRISDKMGTLKLVDNMKSLPYFINSSKIPNGNYVINITYGTTTESIQVLINH